MFSTIKRILALLIVLSLLAVAGLTLFFAVTGSEYFWGMLVLMFFYPVFLWAMALVHKWAKNQKRRIRTALNLPGSGYALDML